MSVQPAGAGTLQSRREPTLLRSETGESLPWLDSAVCSRCQAANDAAASVCCECGSDLSLGRPSRPISYYVGFDPEQVAGSRYSLQIVDAEPRDAPCPLAAACTRVAGAAGAVAGPAGSAEAEAGAGAVAGGALAAPRRSPPAVPRRSPHTAALLRSSAALASVAIVLAGVVGVRHYMQAPSLERAWVANVNSQQATAGAQDSPDHLRPAPIVPAAPVVLAVPMPAAALPAAAVPASPMPATIATPRESAGSILALPTPPPQTAQQGTRPAAAGGAKPQPRNAAIERQGAGPIACTEAVIALALCDAPAAGR